MILVLYIAILGIVVAIGIALAPFVLPVIGILALLVAVPFVLRIVFKLAKHTTQTSKKILAFAASLMPVLLIVSLLVYLLLAGLIPHWVGGAFFLVSLLINAVQKKREKGSVPVAKVTE